MNRRLLKQEIVSMLSADTPAATEKLFSRANDVLTESVGNAVSLRGLIEFSNVCARDCLYCGIRKSNSAVERYTITISDVIEAAKKCSQAGYGSLVLQSGERSNPNFVDFVCDCLKEIKRVTATAKQPDGLGITLSVGEQSEKTYERFLEAGAHRYLLRIETSNPALFRRLHPESQSFENRVNCLQLLKKIGYLTGTGVMIGLPGQTLEDLADDILFFKDLDADMIGMGPFIPSANTPLASAAVYPPAKRLALSLNMIAATRIVLKNVNIAAASALDAISPDGRLMGIKAGANVAMIQMMDTTFTKNYTLYGGKTSSDTPKIIKMLSEINRAPRTDTWGDARVFVKPQKG